MIALVKITYLVPLEIVEQHTAAHRAHLASLHRRGKLLASGPFVPRTGGMLVMQGESEAEIEALTASDPYRTHAVARFEIQGWAPILGADALAAMGSLGVLHEKVVIVTGASSGIGEATASALASEGATVVAVARRRDRLDALAARIEAGGRGRCITHEADLVEESEARALIDRVQKELGRLDVLVNNAGVMLLSPIADARPEDWRRMIELNLVSVMSLTQAALPLLKAAKGHVVNVASVAGRIANPGASAYAATKFGIVAFSESLRREVYEDRVRVTVIEPGMVRTELGDHITNASMKASLTKRLGAVEPLEASDIASTIVHAVKLPARASVNEVLIRPTDQER